MNKENGVKCAKFCSKLAQSILSCNDQYSPEQSSKVSHVVSSILPPIYLLHLLKELNQIESGEPIIGGYTKAALNFLLEILSPYKEIYISEDSILFNKSNHLILELSSTHNDEVKRLSSILLQDVYFEFFPTSFDHRRINLCAEMICRIQTLADADIDNENENENAVISGLYFFFHFFLRRALHNELSSPQV